MKKLTAVLLSLALVLSLCGFGLAFADEAPEEDGFVYEDVFADWNEGAPALNALIEYVEAVTDEASPDFIPVEDRLAVFDMDGTLYGELFPTYLEYYTLAWRILEDPSIVPDSEMLALGRELRESVISGSFASDMPLRHAIQAARAYSGLTLQEFAAYINGCLVREVDGFEGMTYATAFYTPMLEVIEYLQDNEFKVFVCSGSDRFICRVLLEGMIDIPYENIIGMDVGFEATGQGDVDGLDYVFKAGDDVVRTEQLIIKNLKMNKVLQIVQDIGRKPVLSFGNSSGDVSMHMYTVSDNPYRSAAFMLIANDDERDYGNVEKAERLGEQWEAAGFHVISMRDDFRTIYGDNVVKTGSFRWADEMAEERIPMEGESGRYTFHDLSSAALLVEESLSSWGCELHALRYAGDEANNEENLSWLKNLGEGAEYVECLEFVTDFHSPAEGEGAWNYDTEYTDYQWWLARTEGGSWELLSWGY